MAKSNAIGSGSVILTANADGLTAGLNKSAADVGRWGSRVQKSAGSMAGGMLGLGKRVGMTLGRGLTLGAGIQLGKNLIGGGAGGGMFGGMFSDRLQELGRAGETARVFGMTAEAYTGMAGAAKAAGSSQREFIESLATIGKLGSDAALGTEGASRAFQLLGLNAEEFNRLPTEDKYYTIMDAIARVTNETDRMYLAGQALGEDGMKNLLPLIGKTGDELREMSVAFQRSGSDIAEAQRAMLTMRAANASMEKAFDSVVIALAPAFEYVSVLIPMAVDALGSQFSGMGDIVTPVLRALSVGAGYLWDTIKAGAGIVTNIAGTIVETMGMVGQVFAEELVGGIAGAFDGLLKIAKTWASIMPASVTGPLGDEINAIPDDLFSGTLVAATKEAGAQMQDEGKRIADIGKGMVDEFGQSAAAAGAFFDDFERRRAAALAPKPKAVGPKLAPELKPFVPKLAGALEAGSKDAYSAVVKHSLPEINKAADEGKKQTQALKDVVNRVEKLTEVVKDSFQFAAI